MKLEIKLCPECKEILYPINSLSDKMECLSKTCNYSEVPKVGIYDPLNYL